MYIIAYMKRHCILYLVFQIPTSNKPESNWRAQSDGAEHREVMQWAGFTPWVENLYCLEEGKKLMGLLLEQKRSKVCNISLV